jgi:XTP/dITP diphosphohydrolase
VTRLVLASGNAGKLRELDALLAPLHYEVLFQAELGIKGAVESGATFLENALLKARHAAGAARLPALAEDSGIEVDALGGRPGVHSARYAGASADDRTNVAKLLEELRDVPPEGRTARYRCVIALLRSAEDPDPLIAEGAWEGRILDAPRGQGGFGYDPVFLPIGSDRSAAELAPQEKNRASHRAQALLSLVSRIHQWH